MTPDTSPFSGPAGVERQVMSCRADLDVHTVQWPNATCDCGKLAANLAVRCRDGFHRSGTQGYGHQKCIQCGLEWEFNPPQRVAVPLAHAPQEPGSTP